MTARLLPRDRIDEFVRRLLDRVEVIAPRRLEGGDVFYQTVNSPGEVAWDYSVAIEPLKRFLLPQRETVLKFRKENGIQVEAPYDERERVFLGVRNCDVTGVAVLDGMYASDPPDPYYVTRRERSTFITLACQDPAEQCFCVCGDAGPFLHTGYDQQWTELPDGMLVEVGSPRGEELATAVEDLLQPAEVEHVALRHRLAKEAEEKFGDYHSYIAGAMSKLTLNEVEPEVWEQAEDQCLECGSCTFLCPTCSCFTTTDRWEGAQGLRERHWDACLFSAYAREASGHNPRPRRADRLRNRFFHKVSHQWAERNGRHACVGCGRCVVGCMAWAHMPAATEGIRRGAMR
jgi:ferredoxin